MRKRILISVGTVAVLATILTTILMSFVAYNRFYQNTKEDMIYNIQYISNILNNAEDPIKEASTLLTKERVTIIDPSGVVLYDNMEDASAMENHGDRPEIQNALSFGRGESTRFSDTIGLQTYYYATKLPSGDILRIAVTDESVVAIILGMVYPYMVVVVLVVLIIAFLVARLATKRIVTPLNTMAPEDYKITDIYPELSPFVTKIRKQNELISSQLVDLSKSQQQFSTIVENMGEGLILTDKKGDILFMNSSATAFLGLYSEADYINKPVLELNRSLELKEVVDKALSGVKSEYILAHKGREYSVAANPVSLNNTIDGAVLILVDITEKRESEQLRREFSANVSHELKTPLTSISGYAEIMKNGMVSSEDVVPFAEKIYTESTRLINLIQDIIYISRLDEEKITAETVKINLADVASDVAERFMAAAEQAGVELKTELSEVTVAVFPQIIEEIISNIVDNAIKYNKPKGSVMVKTSKENDLAVLTVKDTGIGIPVASQKRVFERFYRVDKSHSKETGGTGLGLSIVKHGVERLGGKIQLKSSEKGTEIKIYLPISR